MSAPSKSGKAGLRWGGFLQQAVASVESRLDTILAEDDTSAAKSTTESQSTQAPRSPHLRAERKSGDLSRSSSGAKPNDRLQERLAKAIARSNSPKPSDSTVHTPAASVSRSDTPSGERSEENSAPADSGFSQAPVTNESSVARLGDEDNAKVESLDQTLPQNRPESAPVEPLVTPPENATDPPSISSSARLSLDAGLPDHHDKAETDLAVDSNASKGPELPPYNEIAEALVNLQAEQEAAEKKWQDELHVYIEKMDTMQSKLFYLTKEAATNAHTAAANASTGSMEKKLLEKEEKIALLMEEGQKLSKTELHHMTTIKKLRVQAAEGQKLQKDLRSQIEKADMEKQRALERTKRAEVAAKKAEGLVSSSSKSDKEIEALKQERNALNATVADIKSQLARALSRAETAETKAQSDALEREKRKVAELRDDLNSKKVEYDMTEEKLRREVKELKDSLEKEKVVSRALETELRGEQTAMERKLESLRSRAEDITSSSDSQAKLLRQVETLQTQYAVASENWQGIEGSLLTRLANVEKERDEAVSKDEDLRRRARDAGSRAKKLETELEKAREHIDDLERSLSERQSEVDKLSRRVQQTMEDLNALKKDFERQAQTQEAALSQRLEEERLRWREQSSNLQALRTESPAAPSRKFSGLDLSHLAVAPSERAPSRRSSVLPSQVIDSNTPPRQNSLSSISRAHGHALIPETPSIQSFDREDFLSIPATPLSPPTNGFNDLISVSTVAAGPSVQLVERMSANVRRLETERAASKDEIARLTAQRDEAREEVVDLMRASDEKQAADERIKALEEESKKMDDRYQTTLEMLGEKSEMVEELKADVADLKKIYRELVDNTMK